MSGLKLVVPVTFTDAALPVLLDDPILAAGSLALYEPAHPNSPIVGVPADLSLIPNIAFKQAVALIPGATAAELSAVLRTAGINPATANGKLERSTKGGIHTIISKATAFAAAGVAYGAAYGQEKVAQYILTNTATHEFYISYWGRESRSASNASNLSLAGLSFATTASGTNCYGLFSHDGNNYPLAGANRTGSFSSTTGTMWDTNAGYPATIPNQIRKSIAILGTASTIGKTAAQVIAANYFKLFGAGRVAEVFGAGAAAGNSSHLWYRTYIEDLTVSGRTFATVDAIDSAQYTKQVLTAGGRYYGDTFTDPATIA